MSRTPQAQTPWQEQSIGPRAPPFKVGGNLTDGRCGANHRRSHTLVHKRRCERYSSGGGKNTISCLAESATTSGGFCSFMPWIAQNRSYSLRVGVTQNRHLIGCSDLLNRP